MELPLSLQSIYITLNGLFTTDMNHFIAPLSIMIKKRKADSQSKNCLLQTEIFALDFCSLRDFSTAVSEHFVYTLLPALNMQLILFALKYSSISFFMSSISVCGKLKSSNQIIMSLFSSGTASMMAL